MSAALETRALCKSFGALTVAEKIDFRLEPGARHALIGPNGAGKTTFVNMLTGVLAPSSGTHRARGRGHHGTQPGEAREARPRPHLPDQRAVPEAAGARQRCARGCRAPRRGAADAARGEQRIPTCATRAWSCSRRLGLADDAGQRILDLPYGKQRLVEIAIALGLKPRVLLLDEPAAGVPSLESHRILQVLDNLPRDIAILIIEHDMDLVFRFARRITVLVQGEVLVEGTPEEIGKDKRVHQVYLGEQRHG